MDRNKLTTYAQLSKKDYRAVLEAELLDENLKSPARNKLIKLLELNTDNPEKINDNLIKLTADEELIWNSYEKIKRNKGSTTYGTKKQTPDEFKKEIVTNISNDIKNGYKWSDIRRKNIPKPGKKNEMRPLGIPNFYDKIVQENIRIILNTIYEPIFQKLEANHGFRPNRSTESAITRIKDNSNGMTTAIEGDFRKAYDNIKKETLINILKNKISDKKFLKLIETSFDIKFIEDETKRIIDNQGIGVPQGGLASPILFNIVMHEFDKETIEIVKNFLEKKNIEEDRIEKSKSIEYEKLRIKINNHKRAMKNNSDKDSIKLTYKNFEKHKQQKKELRKFLSLKRTTEPMAKCKQSLFFSYTRYADDWIILTNADVKTCNEIKKLLAEWAKINIGLELNEEKTLITDLRFKNAKFLGFTIYKAAPKIITYLLKGKKEKRRLNVGLCIGIDQERIINRLINEKIINEKRQPIHNSKYAILEPWQIVRVYTQKIRGLINYYYHSINIKGNLTYLYYLLKYSCLKTLANRQKSSIKSIILKYGNNLKMTYNTFDWDIKEGKEKKKEWVEEYPSYIELMDWAGRLSTNKITQRIGNRLENKIEQRNIEIKEKNKTTKNNSVTKKNILKDIMLDPIEEPELRGIKFNLRSGFQCRKWCIICYEPNGEYNPIQTHHVKHLKTGKINGFDTIMKALNRKTIPVCKNCHEKIHNKEYNGIALGKILDRVLATLN